MQKMFMSPALIFLVLIFSPLAFAGAPTRTVPGLTAQVFYLGQPSTSREHCEAVVAPELQVNEEQLNVLSFGTRIFTWETRSSGPTPGYCTETSEQVLSTTRYGRKLTLEVHLEKCEDPVELKSERDTIELAGKRFYYKVEQIVKDSTGRWKPVSLKEAGFECTWIAR